MADADCQGCNFDNKFEDTKSSTYQSLGTEPRIVSYGSGSMFGAYGQDTVCLSKDTCATDVRFLGCEYIGFDLIQSDGILGLLPVADQSESDLFVDKLFRQNKIAKRQFSFLIDSQDNTGSKMTLGGYDMDKFAEKDSSI